MTRHVPPRLTHLLGAGPTAAAARQRCQEQSLEPPATAQSQLYGLGLGQMTLPLCFHFPISKMELVIAATSLGAWEA